MWEKYAIFIDLRKEIKKPTRTVWEKAVWISEANWRLEDHRTSLRGRHTAGQRELRVAMGGF